MRRLLSFARSLFSLFLFGVALWIVRDILREYNYHQVVEELRAIPVTRLVASFALTVFGYLALVGYDFVALRFIGHPLGVRVVLPVSFVSFAVANSAPAAIITGGGLRYRLYSRWGLTAVETAEVAAVDVVTYVLGLFSVGGLAFVIEPLVVPATLHVPFHSARPVGIAFLAVVVAYGMVALIRHRPIHFRHWVVHAPTPRLAAEQLVVSSLDWLLSGAALWVLLPTALDVSYPAFLGAFLLAQIAALISPLPGGLGVFEAVVLLLVPRGTHAAGVLGALVVYRVIYYLLPLLTAAAILVLGYVRTKRPGAAAGAIERWVIGLVPDLLALATFIAGAVLLFSAAVPVARPALEVANRLLPLAVIELAHVLGGVSGLLLLFLAWGLGRRMRLAYWLTVALLAAGVFFSLLRGFVYVQAIALGVLLALILPAHRAFYRTGPLTRARFGAGWTAAILITLLATLWLGLFAYPETQQPWRHLGRFAISAEAGRFVRTIVAVVATLATVVLIRIVRVSPPRPELPGPESLDRAGMVVDRSPHPGARLALLGDKAFLFSDDRTAFITYASGRRVRVALGDAVGPPAERAELAWRFRDLADHDGAWAVLYDVPAVHQDLYADLGLQLEPLGDAARVSLRRAPDRLTELARPLAGESYALRVVPPEDVAGVTTELSAIARAWSAAAAAGRAVGGFARAYFDPAFMARSPVAVVRRSGEAVAFASVWPGADRVALAADVVRYRPGLPDDAWIALLARVMLWGRDEGFREFDLGLAQPERPPGGMLAELHHRIAVAGFRYAEHVADPAALREAKQRFDPVWLPRYLALPGGFRLPGMLDDVARLLERPAPERGPAR